MRLRMWPPSTPTLWPACQNWRKKHVLNLVTTASPAEASAPLDQPILATQFPRMARQSALGGDD